MATPPVNVEGLGLEVQRLTINVQRASRDGALSDDSKDEFIDALDDLRAELVGPMKWPGTFLAPPKFAALQVAFNRDIFQHVPGGAANVEGTPEYNGHPLTDGHAETASSISAKDLASAPKLDEDVLVRIMRVLIVKKTFTEVSENTFAHTPISAEMANEFVAARLGGIFNEVYKASSSLAETLDNGGGKMKQSAWETRFGMPLYEYFERHPGSDRDRIAKAMTVSATKEIEELADIYPWRDHRKIVDIGGSAGFLCSQLTLKHPHLQSVTQDLPQVIDDQKKRIEKISAAARAAYDRVEFQAYNYFDPQPQTDADAFILRRCLHDNLDVECVKMLKSVVPGLEHGGARSRLLINENLMPAWDWSSTRQKSKMVIREDIVMMISVNGKERTLKEFEGLCKEADARYEVDQVYPGRNHFAVVSVKLVV